jgi:hypothetical protein
MSFLDRFFGPSYQKELTTLAPTIAEINQLEATYAEVSPLNICVTRQLSSGQNLLKVTE